MIIRLYILHVVRAEYTINIIKVESILKERYIHTQSMIRIRMGIKMFLSILLSLILKMPPI